VVLVYVALTISAVQGVMASGEAVEGSGAANLHCRLEARSRPWTGSLKLLPQRRLHQAQPLGASKWLLC
jgi:hypothetical protein